MITKLENYWCSLQVTANDGDCISLVQATNVWIDHNELFNLDPAKQTNKDLYDGLVDVTTESQFITVSWNFFHDHHKCNLIGHSDKHDVDKDMTITFHHNLYRNIGSRTPSVRFATAHLYDNVYDNILESGINSRMGACLRIENNYFTNAQKVIALPEVAKKWEIFKYLVMCLWTAMGIWWSWVIVKQAFLMTIIWTILNTYIQS